MPSLNNGNQKLTTKGGKSNLPITNNRSMAQSLRTRPAPTTFLGVFDVLLVLRIIIIRNDEATSDTLHTLPQH